MGAQPILKFCSTVFAGLISILASKSMELNDKEMLLMAFAVQSWQCQLTKAILYKRDRITLLRKMWRPYQGALCWIHCGTSKHIIITIIELIRALKLCLVASGWTTPNALNSFIRAKLIRDKRVEGCSGTNNVQLILCQWYDLGPWLETHHPCNQSKPKTCHKKTLRFGSRPIFSDLTIWYLA